MSVHYWYLESEGDPTEDPILLWTNGGPGASSMFGLLVELGPLVVNDDSFETDSYAETGVPTLFRNEYAWTKLGGVVMFDWSPPVGFSYCDDPSSGDPLSCGAWEDSRMARLMAGAVTGFFDKFPELLANDLYLTGESYAGVYVPLLAEQLMNRRSEFPNLKGFAVGDACAGTDVVCGGGEAPWWSVIFLYGHGQVSNALFDAIVASCGLEYLKNLAAEPLDAECAALLASMRPSAGGYYEYNLYDDCAYEDDIRRRRKLGAVNDYVCGGGVAQNAWVNVSEVRAALHVPEDSTFFSIDGGSFYHSTEPDVSRVFKQGADLGLKMLVYNGDTDPSINSFIAQNWTSYLFDLVDDWTPWTLDSCLRMGGYVLRYEHDFDFLTIRGSGHMVPQFKPAAAFSFLEDWLAGAPYKPYVSDCTAPASGETELKPMVLPPLTDEAAAQSAPLSHNMMTSSSEENPASDAAAPLR